MAILTYVDNVFIFESIYDDSTSYDDFLSSLGIFTIDWGDGTIQQYQYQYTDRISHQYNPGDYLLKIKSPFPVFLDPYFISMIISATGLKCIFIGNAEIISFDFILNCPDLVNLYLFGVSGVTTIELDNLLGLFLLKEYPLNHIMLWPDHIEAPSIAITEAFLTAYPLVTLETY